MFEKVRVMLKETFSKQENIDFDIEEPQFLNQQFKDTKECLKKLEDAKK